MDTVTDNTTQAATPPPASDQSGSGYESAMQQSYTTPGYQSGDIVRQGNIDLATRPNINNGDGTHSSVFSMSFGIDDGEILVPGVGDGKTYPLRKLTPTEALDQYRKTGKNLGLFATPAAADKYAEKLHEDQQNGITRSATGQSTPQQQESQFKENAAMTPPKADGSMSSPAAPDMGAPPEPVVLTPHLSPFVSAMQKVVDAIAGTRGQPRMATDQNGNKYVQDTTMSTGQQWRKIAGEALTGAAAGLAAGKGAGNAAKAPMAGIQAQQQQQQGQQQQRQQLSDEAQKENLQNANNQMLQMNMAHQAWDFTHHQIEATQQDIGFWNGQEDRLIKEGGRELGTAKNNADIASILHVQPDVMEQMVKNQTIKVLPNVGADGKAAGIKVIMMPGSYQKQVEEAGAQFPTFNKLTGEYDWHKTSEPSTKGEIDAYWTAAASDRLAFENQKAEQGLKAAQTEEATSRANAGPSEIAKNTAQVSVSSSEIRKNNAEADKAIAEANKAKTPDAADPQVANLGEAVARGSLTQDQISKFGKNTLGAVQNYLTQHHPDLDQGSVFMTASERKQVDLARNSLENLGKMQEIIQRRPDLIGVLDGRITQGKFGAGTNDRDLGYIEEALDNFGLATTGTHGTRAQMAREDAKRALFNGFHNGPQATQGAFDAAKNSLNNLASAGKPRGVNGQPYVYNQGGAPKTAAAAPAGATGQAMGRDGKMHWADASGKDYGVVQQ